MKVELLALCDAATESGGKLNMLGIYDTIQAAAIPAVHARCAIVIKLRFERIERGEHRIKLNIIDQDGNLVIPSLDAPMTMNFPDTASSGTVQLILDMQNLRFQKYGEFAIDLAVDGRQEGSIPLFLKPAPVAHT